MDFILVNIVFILLYLDCYCKIKQVYRIYLPKVWNSKTFKDRKSYFRNEGKTIVTLYV